MPSDAIRKQIYEIKREATNTRRHASLALWALTALLLVIILPYIYYLAYYLISPFAPLAGLPSIELLATPWHVAVFSITIILIAVVAHFSFVLRKAQFVVISVNEDLRDGKATNTLNTMWTPKKRLYLFVVLFLVLFFGVVGVMTYGTAQHHAYSFTDPGAINILLFVITIFACSLVVYRVLVKVSDIDVILEVP